jgi:hypothetical protein
LAASDEPNGRSIDRYAPRAIAGVAFAIGVALAVDAIPRLLLYGDELHSLASIERPVGELMREFGINGSGSALLVLQHAGLALFGPTPWALRWPALLGCVGALALIYPAGRQLTGGAAPAALAALALALNPMHEFYARFGRSYALVVFLALGLGHALARATGRDAPSRGAYAGVAVCAALLPYAHLSAAGFVPAVAAAAAGALAWQGRLRRHGPWLAGSLALGAAACAALYAPALAPLREFVELKAGSDTVPLAAVPDVFTLLAGGPGLGALWMLALPIAAAAMLVRRRADALIPVVAAFAMGPALALARPVGNEWAYARYLLPGLPFALLVLAWGWCDLARRLRLAPLARLGVGVASVLAGFSAGAHGPGRTDDGPFASSYLGWTGLPAFDAPWHGAPPFYTRLAREPGPVRVLETPELWDQARALYRNYYLQHRQPVGIGFVERTLPEGLRGPVAQPLRADPEGFDYLVLHRDVRREIERYWRFVLEHAWPAHYDPEREPFMRHQLTLAVPPPGPQPGLEARWRARYGEPVYEDEDLLVWKTDGADPR